MNTLARVTLDPRGEPDEKDLGKEYSTPYSGLGVFDKLFSGLGTGLILRVATINLCTFKGKPMSTLRIWMRNNVFLDQRQTRTEQWQRRIEGQIMHEWRRKAMLSARDVGR
jgi:hypothetical protein